MSEINKPLSLFRPQVLTAYSSQWVGSIRLAQPLSAWAITFMALVVGATLVAYASFGSITKKARVAGITVPTCGSLTINAPNVGVLIHTHVTEGQRVVAGQTLFELSTERQGNQGEITALISQQLAARQQSLETEQRLRATQYLEKKQAIIQHLNNLAAEAGQLEQEIALAQRRHDLGQSSLSKYEALQASGYVSPAQTQQKQEDLIDLAARVSSLNRNKLQLQANRQSLQADLAVLANNLATDNAQLQGNEASLQQEMAENHSRKGSLIVAAQAGIVTTITYQPGQAVSAGQVLATMIPASGTDTATACNSLEVHLYTPSRNAGFVIPGQQVLIRFSAYPYQKFGLQQGRVIDVSKTPFAPNELPPNLASTILSNAQQTIQGFNSNEALYRIKVRLDKQSIEAYGQAQYLKPGMTLEADVMQDRRKIWEWIVEPILAVTHR
ncbi:HlyD family secretion protein [Collimonas arenae]|uniref:HlyD family secretion protein n=1 Tax=Collimonas arenae TaxID=279058 RepID=A0A0A1F7F7_9BURK|nr:HlyD family efflux transporter periplasmic adaptor subunit [Collimonas arenae]AIY39624.1 HlyD family secretion protein [Collimonas arenae]